MIELTHLRIEGVQIRHRPRALFGLGQRLRHGPRDGIRCTRRSPDRRRCRSGRRYGARRGRRAPGRLLRRRPGIRPGVQRAIEMPAKSLRASGEDLFQRRKLGCIDPALAPEPVQGSARPQQGRYVGRRRREFIVPAHDTPVCLRIRPRYHLDLRIDDTVIRIAPQGTRNH